MTNLCFSLSNNLVNSRKSFTVYYEIILNVKEFLTAFIWELKIKNKKKINYLSLSSFFFFISQDQFCAYGILPFAAFHFPRGFQ